MSDLRLNERLRLEKLFQMSSGYVLGFSNRSFEEFVSESIDLDITGVDYSAEVGSKANRLRKIWRNEPNHLVARLTGDLVDRALELVDQTVDEALTEECRGIVRRLTEGSPMRSIDSVIKALAEPEFDALRHCQKIKLVNIGIWSRFRR